MRGFFSGLLIVGFALWGPGALADDVGGGDIPVAERVDLEELAKDREEKAKKYGVKPRTKKKITSAIEALEEERFEDAQKILDGLSYRRMNPYERAVAYRIGAYVAFNAGDHEGAVDAFGKVLEQEVLRLDDEASIRFNIVQLRSSMGQWEKVIEGLEDWFRYEEDPNPLAYYLMAIAYFQLDKTEEALEPARQAVARSPDPREGWLQLLAALYVQKEDYAGATPVLEQLVVRFPKKQYWVQLALIYGAQNQYDESLAIQQLAYAQGFLTEGRELSRLGRSYLYHALPHPAAEVLSEGLESGRIEMEPKALEMLANAWIAAREYDAAIAPLQQAASISEDGKLYVRLSQVHIQREEWGKCAELLGKALEKGGLKDAGNAQLLLGICLYSDGRVSPAQRWFERAQGHDSTQTQARAWLQHISNEVAAQGETASATGG